MIGRRGFLAALSSPFLARAMPAPVEATPMLATIALTVDGCVRSTDLFFLGKDGVYSYVGTYLPGEKIKKRDDRYPYWHGQPPVVFMPLATAIPWKLNSSGERKFRTYNKAAL